MVGNAVEHAFQPVVERLNQVEGLMVTMAALASDYWGRDITVTGLLTGHDLLKELQDRPPGGCAIAPLGHAQTQRYRRPGPNPVFG